MKIYYINSEEFLKQYDTEFLRNYAGNMEFKSVKRFTQYTIGRYLVKSVGERDFNILDTEIEIVDEKPRFKYSNIKFSITHCGKYIAAAFDTAECGLDIEEMKETREEEEEDQELNEDDGRDPRESSHTRYLE